MNYYSRAVNKLPFKKRVIFMRKYAGMKCFNNALQNEATLDELNLIIELRGRVLKSEPIAIISRVIGYARTKSVVTTARVMLDKLKACGKIPYI